MARLGADLFTNVALTSISSRTPTVREVWRTVQQADVLGVSSLPPKVRSSALRWRLKLLNILGMAYYLTLGSVITLTGLLITSPAVYTDKAALWRTRTILYFVYANMMLNYLLVILYGGHFCFQRERPLLPLDCPKDTKTFCEVCQKNIPVRAKHCVLCDSCILKRDHHCFFTGCCVGFRNQRYFVVFCFYAAIGSFFNVMVDMEFLRITSAEPFSSNFYRFFLPWCFGAWLFGSLSSGEFAMITLTYLTFMTGMACGWFFFQQLFLIYRGQTTHEYYRGIKIYRTFPNDHFKSVFGSFWVLNFMIPMPWFKNGDGKYWNVLKHV